MPKALVLGVNGQDGSYVAEALLRRKYSVVGIGRQSHSRYVLPSDAFQYRQLDLTDRAGLLALLAAERPEAVFHVAAIHGAAGFRYEPVFAAMMAVNVVAAQTVLDYARTTSPGLKLVYANSAKIFPTPLVGSIDEGTPMRPTCLYSMGKIAALELIRYYRRVYGVAAANLILFNHESPRRTREYFLPTLAAGLVQALRDPAHQIQVKTLDFYMDWSAAEELMDIAVDIAERAPNDDLVLASGTTVYAREMVKEWFARHGLDYAKHVLESLPPQKPNSPFHVAVDCLQAKVGRKPQRTVHDIVDELTRTTQASR